ncbi:hypothetical protein Cadr_000002667 [Camelus dromedarius]|uniref:Uncharacterized protein n=1 Tax=Camelus dromedarius TaxID=9838 RepID=A0A5N4C2E6_CAMDR|nr:hypothetical protein Cadr_000002667 [Camelus dromedarius]
MQIHADSQGKENTESNEGYSAGEGIAVIRTKQAHLKPSLTAIHMHVVVLFEDLTLSLTAAADCDVSRV